MKFKIGFSVLLSGLMVLGVIASWFKEEPERWISMAVLSVVFILAMVILWMGKKTNE